MLFSSILEKSAIFAENFEYERKYRISKGYLLENLVYLDLLRHGYDVYVGSVKDKELDFVAISQWHQAYQGMGAVAATMITCRSLYLFVFILVKSSVPNHGMDIPSFGMYVLNHGTDVPRLRIELLMWFNCGLTILVDHFNHYL